MNYYILLICALFSIAVWGQTDFDHYSMLHSHGAIPEDFSTPTQHKITHTKDQRLAKLSPAKRKEFLTFSNYAIDELLHSGTVTYGDPVSQYITSIAARLLVNDSVLRKSLRFYTINENSANAFSTNQGMVFVTTGLIAQMTSEAQLAFVLGHEIAHYSEGHVIDMFDYSTSNSGLSYKEKTRFFSKYSRQNELEADEIGVKYMHDAGYSSSEIEKTFDVLLYSYLPFEEIAFDKNYFTNQWMFVPETVFNKPKVEISAAENYNDRFASHPNIATRKEEIQQKIDSLKTWENRSAYDQQTFEEVRNICRFEFVLNDVYNDNSIEALYGIYILEKQFPTSNFLRNCKSQIWLAHLTDFESNEDYSEFDYYSEESEEFSEYDLGYEGQISVFAQGYSRLSSDAKLAMSLRIIRDNYLSDTTDKIADRLWKKAVELIAANTNFNIENYSKYTFNNAIIQYQKEKIRTDSINKAVGLQQIKYNKYETIKNSKIGFDKENGIDSTKFYLYALSDLIADSTFLKLYASFSKGIEEMESETDEFFDMTDEEQTDFYVSEYEQKLHIGMDSVLLLQPEINKLERYNRKNFEKSDQLTATFYDVTKLVTDDLKIKQINLNRSNHFALTTADFNAIASFNRAIAKRSENETSNFIIDTEILDSLRKKYATNELLFVEIKSMNRHQISVPKIVAYSILFPIGVFYLPKMIFNNSSSNYVVKVLDLKMGELVVNESYFAFEPATKKFMNARLNAIFHQLKQKK